jgi:hypothetical protein
VCPRCSPPDARPLLPRWLIPLITAVAATAIALIYDTIGHPVDHSGTFALIGFGVLPLGLRLWPWGTLYGDAPLEYPIQDTGPWSTRHEVVINLEPKPDSTQGTKVPLAVQQRLE